MKQLAENAAIFFGVVLIGALTAIVVSLAVWVVRVALG